MLHQNSKENNKIVFYDKLTEINDDTNLFRFSELLKVSFINIMINLLLV